MRPSSRCLLPVVVGLVPGMLAAQLAPSAAPPSTGDLPPVACVEAIRAARLARDRGETMAARQGLETALDVSACELAALSDLLRLLREDPAAADRAGALRERLAARLGDPATPLPPGLLSQLARLGWVDPDRGGDALLLESIERRRRAAEAGGRQLPPTELIEVLEVTANLQERLDHDEAARETLARLLTLAPTDALRWRALIYDLERERWSNAAELLVAMKSVPGAPEVLQHYHVGVLAHLGRYDEMLRELERLAPQPGSSTASVPGGLPAGFGPSEETSGFVALLIEAAWALRDAGRDPEAAALFRRALTYDVEHREAQAALLHLYGTAEERTAAAAAIESRREAETDPRKLFEEGTDLLGAGDAAGALVLLARAAPDLAGSDYAEPAWYNLGSAAVKIERWDEAARAFEQAIAANPQRVESHFKRGVALYHLDRCREALPALAQTLKLQADKLDAHYYLGACYKKLGDPAAAAREMALFEGSR